MRRDVRGIPSLCVTLTVLAALLAAGCAGSSSGASSSATTVTSPTPTPASPLPNLDAMLAEKTVGSATAPVTMIEYSSLTCSHCGDFHVSTYPLIKAAYIDTGKVRFVFRDFPLNDGAVIGAMVARCSGDRYFTALDALFRSQASWAYAPDYTAGIKRVVAGIGMTAADVDACLAASDLRAGILAIKSGGITQFGVNATPTFLVNGQKIMGALPYSDFATVLDAAR